MRLIALGILLASTGSAHAAQTRYDIDKERETWSFDVAWTGSDGAAHSASFTLPAAGVQEDLETPLTFRKNDAAQMVAKKVNNWAASLRDVKIKAKAKGGDIQISASGSSSRAVKDALAEAAIVRDEAMDSYLAGHGYRRLDKDIIPDHPGHVDAYAADLAPVVEALGGSTPDPRDFATLALGFVQNIPYEHRTKISDRYRRPLSLLGRNKGDCDSKTVLYLALLRAAYPDLPLAIVYIPGHAFGAVGLDPIRGDTSFREEGQVWVGVEPVGPALAEVGELGGKSRRRVRWGRADILIVGAP